MKNHNFHIDELIEHFANSLPALPNQPVKETGTKILELINQLRQENLFLKEKLRKADNDLKWMEMRADEWMLKAMEKSQNKSSL
ncbi:hypothetical protein [Mesobacillus foraminis]|uniref:Uncharacterized protein n=1 Tax=Mesobacillus foraminis TaxID=279826 RepID=A0A4R2BKP8_9BACI|nr:hypothetical protein [Mesobacillus foraminis]TCN26709.1 hypothetical protein EV146_103232 [Mesobacillus foraminis]